MLKAKISIRKLKDFAYRELPKNWPLREILLLENEEIDVSTFLARLPLWLRLSTLKRGDSS